MWFRLARKVRWPGCSSCFWQIRQMHQCGPSLARSFSCPECYGVCCDMQIMIKSFSLSCSCHHLGPNVIGGRVCWVGPADRP